MHLTLGGKFMDLFQPVAFINSHKTEYMKLLCISNIRLHDDLHGGKETLKMWASIQTVYKESSCQVCSNTFTKQSPFYTTHFLPKKVLHEWWLASGGSFPLLLVLHHSLHHERVKWSTSANKAKLIESNCFMWNYSLHCGRNKAGMKSHARNAIADAWMNVVLHISICD